MPLRFHTGLFRLTLVHIIVLLQRFVPEVSPVPTVIRPLLSFSARKSLLVGATFVVHFQFTFYIMDFYISSCRWELSSSFLSVVGFQMTESHKDMLPLTLPQSFLDPVTKVVFLRPVRVQLRALSRVHYARIIALTQRRGKKP